MSGHSKWVNIRERKGAQDKKKAKLFTKIIKDIFIAIKENGMIGDPDANPALRNIIQNAKAANIAKDTIQRAIKKATGADSRNYERVNFEGYGAHGIAVFLECATDNINRTVQEMRAIFTKFGGQLGTNGSVEFLFQRKGVFTLSKGDLKQDWEDLELEMIDNGAESFEEEEDVDVIYSDYTQFGQISNKLEEMGITPQNAELQRIPVQTTKLSLEHSLTIMKMIDAFEENEDVLNVFHTLEMTDELMEALSKEN